MDERKIIDLLIFRGRMLQALIDNNMLNTETHFVDNIWCAMFNGNYEVAEIIVIVPEIKQSQPMMDLIKERVKQVNKLK
jgi:hypothetical protein